MLESLIAGFALLLVLAGLLAYREAKVWERTHAQSSRIPIY